MVKGRAAQVSMVDTAMQAGCAEVKEAAVQAEGVKTQEAAIQVNEEGVNSPSQEGCIAQVDDAMEEDREAQEGPQEEEYSVLEQLGIKKKPRQTTQQRKERRKKAAEKRKGPPFVPFAH